MTIYLYKKTHNKTGLQYLGKTTQPDPHKYKGSGVRWTNHIKKYGYDVTTEILKECQSLEEATKWGQYYSQLYKVVEDYNWANLKPEDGDGFSTGSFNPNFGGFTDSHKTNLSNSKKGKTPSNFNSWAKAAKGKSYYHSETEEKRFLPDEVPEGWVKGRLKITCCCGKSVDISNFKKYHALHQHSQGNSIHTSSSALLIETAL